MPLCQHHLAMVPGSPLFCPLIYSLEPLCPPHSNADLSIDIDGRSAPSTAITPHFVFLSHLPSTTFHQFSQSGHFPLCRSLCKPNYRGGEHHITAETLLNVRIPSLTSSSFPFFLPGYLPFPGNYFKPSHLPTRDCNSSSSILTPSWWICLWFHSLWMTHKPPKLTCLCTPVILCPSSTDARELFPTNPISCDLDTLLHQSLLWIRPHQGCQWLSHHESQQVHPLDVESHSHFPWVPCPRQSRSSPFWVSPHLFDFPSSAKIQAPLSLHTFHTPCPSLLPSHLLFRHLLLTLQLSSLCWPFSDMAVFHQLLFIASRRVQTLLTESEQNSSSYLQWFYFIFLKAQYFSPCAKYEFLKSQPWKQSLIHPSPSTSVYVKSIAKPWEF